MSMQLHHKRGALGRRLEFYSHPKYGGNVPIYLDTGKAIFSGVIGDVVLQDENLTKLKKLIDESLKNQHNIEWLPVIEISFGGRWNYHDDDNRNSFNRDLEFRFSRYWIAQKIDKKWIQASWNVTHYPDFNKKKVEIGDRLERSTSFGLRYWDKDKREHIEIENLKLPYTKKREDRDDTPVYYLPYTEKLWTTLIEISKRIDDLQKRLIEVLGSQEKRDALIFQTLGLERLLPAGK